TIPWPPPPPRSPLLPYTTLFRSSLPSLPLQHWETWRDLPEALLLGSTLPVLAGEPHEEVRWWKQEAGEAYLGLDVFGSAFFLLRSEEHTSELQSRENLVCRLLLE